MKHLSPVPSETGDKSSETLSNLFKEKKNNHLKKNLIIKII